MDIDIDAYPKEVALEITSFWFSIHELVHFASERFEQWIETIREVMHLYPTSQGVKLDRSWSGKAIVFCDNNSVPLKIPWPSPISRRRGKRLRGEELHVEVNPSPGVTKP